MATVAGAGSKRSLPPKIAKMKARKKQKLDGVGETGVSTRTSRIVKLENLAWQEVQAPESMEDYEGFFGLEEIDGVEVVKEETGGFSFKVADADEPFKPVSNIHIRAKPANEGSRARKARREEVEAEEGEEKEVSQFEEDVWGGLDDDESTPDPAVESQVSDGAVPANGADRAAQAKKLPVNSHSRVLSAPSSIDAMTSSIGFAALQDEADGDEADVSAWRTLGLSNDSLSALSNMRFESPTPIQAAAIPGIQDGRDVIGKAPTGSGKTLAFGIPIVETWLRRQRNAKLATHQGPLALIIEPTRELAQQVTDHISALCAQGDLDKLTMCTLTGGLSIQKQRRLLSRAAIVVATPGRLWEVISEGHGVLTALKSIAYLVVDEADRLLSEGHFKELEQILDALDRETHDATSNAQEGESATTTPSRQTLVFSATFSKTLQQKLSKRHQSLSSSLSSQDSMAYLLRKLNFRQEGKPYFIDVNPDSQMASNLCEGILECPGAEKDLNLYALMLHHQPTTRALVFANSISAVRRLVPFLANLNITAYPLHSQMPQKARIRSVERFSVTSPAPTTSEPQQHTVLVATDLAARGLDIKQVDLVLHYNVPRSADTYIHRSGRTARAGRSGTSILMCAANEAAGVRRLVARVHAQSSSKDQKIDEDEDGGDPGRGTESTTLVAKAAKPAATDTSKPSTTTTRPEAESKRPRQSKRARSLAGRGDLHTLTVPPRFLSALRPRAVLSKTLADASQAKEKTSHEDRWLTAAAEELGVSLSDEEFSSVGRHSQRGSLGHGDGGRVGKRKVRERLASGTTRAEMGAARAELRELLGKRVNIGVSERYLTGGGLDVGELLKSRDGGKGQGAQGEFLGTLEGLGF